MKPDSDEIYELIAKSLTDKLSDDELKSLEEWKLSREINLQEYKDIVTLWTQSGSLRLPESIDLIRARNVIYGKANIHSGKKRWINLAIQAVAVLVLSLIFSGIYSYLNLGREPQVAGVNAPVFQEIKAAFGTQTKVALSDGTVVYLNSGSKLIFPQTFSNQKLRNVKLEGEGYFEVAKNIDQPFVVEANNLRIKVLGTKFNVDAYTDNSLVSVALVEGHVELQSGSADKNINPMQLAPHQVATLDGAKQTLVKADVADLNKYTAWINGRIVFFGDPIQTVVKKLSKWYNVDVVIADKKLEKYQFTGTFINEPVEQVLNILSMTSQMTYTIEPIVKQTDNTMSKRKIILKSKI